MFTQVYFHKTRVAYDIHIRGALKAMLPDGVFPKPVELGLSDYIPWDDWLVLGRLLNGDGGEHGERLCNRHHYRRVYETPEVCSGDDLERLEQAKHCMGTMLVAEEHAGKSWYKTGVTDIPVLSDTRDRKVQPLSKYSSVIASIKSNNQVLLYAKPEDAEAAKAAIERAFPQ